MFSRMKKECPRPVLILFCGDFLNETESTINQNLNDQADKLARLYAITSHAYPDVPLYFVGGNHESAQAAELLQSKLGPLKFVNISEKVVSLVQLTGKNVNVVGLSGSGYGLSI